MGKKNTRIRGPENRTLFLYPGALPGTKSPVP